MHPIYGAFDHSVEPLDKLPPLSEKLAGVDLDIELLDEFDRIALAEAIEAPNHRFQELAVFRDVVAGLDYKLTDAFDRAARNRDQRKNEKRQDHPFHFFLAMLRMLDEAEDDRDEVSHGCDIADHGDHADRGVDDDLTNRL